MRAITMVASELPNTFTGTNADDKRLWTPRISPTLATGITLVAESVVARITIAEPATPAPPLEVNNIVASSANCCPIDRWMPTACARKTETVAQYRHVPS